MKTLAHPHDRSEIRRRLREIRPDNVRRWGRMSAHQMVCHLADALRMAMGQRPVRETSNLFSRTILKSLVLYLPLHWPPGISTCPEIDQERGGTRPADFGSDVAEVEALLEQVPPRDTRLARQPHPLFGRMSESAWLRWGYLHLDHHLRQFGA